MLKIMDIQELVPFAENLANIAGDVVRSYYGTKFDYDVKDDKSPVTIADKEVERNLRAAIRNQYPSHGIIGEEFEDTAAESKYRWVIDPIDGTKSFMIGRPIFGTLIALLENDKPILGLLDQPILGERLIAATGMKTRFNNDDCATRTTRSLDRAVLCTTSPNLFDDKDLESFNNIRKRAEYVVYGGDCYSYGLVARGTVDLVIETGLKPHDFLALVPIIEQAGGVVTDWSGNKMDYNSDGRIIACGSTALHKEVLDII